MRLVFLSKKKCSREIHVSHCVPSNAYRSSHRRCSVRKDVPRNFTKFTGKHPCQSLFFNKVAGQACNFIKKEALALVFSCKCCEISMNTFFTQHVWWTASIKGYFGFLLFAMKISTLYSEGIEAGTGGVL